MSHTQNCTLCNAPLHIHETLSLGTQQLAECANKECAAYMITLTLPHLATLTAEIAATYKTESIYAPRYTCRPDNPHKDRVFG